MQTSRFLRPATVVILLSLSFAAACDDEESVVSGAAGSAGTGGSTSAGGKAGTSSGGNAAAGSAGTTSGGSAGTSNGGSAGNGTGGKAGASNGGSAGNNTGGKAGTSSGGSAGATGGSGGKAGTSAGGSAGAAGKAGGSGTAGTSSGGSAGTSNGGSAGSASGGSAGTSNGGSAGNASGGSAGSASGGSAGSNAGSAGSAGAQLGCVDLTVIDHLNWCSVSIDGAADAPNPQKTCVAPGTEVTLTAKADPSFILGNWHNTPGDAGGGDPGVVTGAGANAVSTVKVKVDSATCVWVCCPFANGTGCETPPPGCAKLGACTAALTAGPRHRPHGPAPPCLHPAPSVLTSSWASRSSQGPRRWPLRLLLRFLSRLPLRLLSQNRA